MSRSLSTPLGSGKVVDLAAARAERLLQMQDENKRLRAENMRLRQQIAEALSELLDDCDVSAEA